MASKINLLIGKRKNAIAALYLTPGKGAITVNDKTMNDYFGRETLRMIINQPFVITNTLNRFDVFANVKGGGLAGQAEAIRHGISKALLEVSTDNRPLLKKAGLLTRDDRIKERKKYGQKGARAKFQFSKR